MEILFNYNCRRPVGIGILMNQGGPTIFFDGEEGGELYLDVMYSDGDYEIN